jgi:hypothetical protein
MSSSLPVAEVVVLEKAVAVVLEVIVIFLSLELLVGLITA